MSRNRIMIRCTKTAVILLFILCTGVTAHASLKAFGLPSSGTQGFPAWYQDNNGLSLQPCWDFNGFCALIPPFCPPALGLGCVGTPINLDPAIPIDNTNFPVETFYFDATTVANIGPELNAKLTQVITLEGSFSTLPLTVAPGQQTTFLRINARVTGFLIPNATYTVVHPFGNYTFTTDATGTPVNVGGTGVFRVVDGCAAAPCDFSLLLPAVTTNIGPWLRDSSGFHTDSVTGNIYIGSGPLSATTVVGSPNGTNFVSVTGPCANGGGAACRSNPVVNTFTDSFFFLSGKVVGVTASPSSIVFPVQKAGVTSAPITVTLKNPDTVNTATLSAFSLADPNANFGITSDTCSGTTLAANGGTCTFGVTFMDPLPGVNGPRSAIVTFPILAPTNRPPVVINLSGTIDNIPPTITSTIPANNAVNVPSNNAITATFSENVTNVDATTFTLTTGGAPVNGTILFDAPSKTAIFTPSANLTTNATYSATITTGVADSVGNTLAQNFIWSFTTALPTTTPPAVISNIPGVNAVNVPNNQVISVTFNEPVDPASVNNVTFLLSSGVTGTISYDPATRTASFTPHSPLVNNQLYTVTITTDIFSLGTIHMAADYTWSFLVNSPPLAISITKPGAVKTTVYSNSYAINWTATVPNGIAGITLGYDTTGTSACNGTQITSRITSTNGPDAFTWDMTTLPQGTYFIYANIADGISTVCSYAASALVKSNANGDINNDGIVDITDALKVLRMAVGLLSPSASEMSFGDVAPLVNGKPQPDGKIDLGDVVVILRRAVGLVSW